MQPTPNAPDLRELAERAMREAGFLSEFGPEVEREVHALDDPSDDRLPPAIEDLRALPWSSVDNRESRDLDQVEVAERLPDGTIRVLIGIADVDELVPRGSAADAHAATNTVSVYTGVVVFPMLPERLSTDLTSLNEGEDRLAIVAQFDVAADGAISGFVVRRALLHNHAKLAYEQVGRWLSGEGRMPPALERSATLREQLQLQHEASRRLRRWRAQAGALDFESVEARPVVAHGKVVDLAVVRRDPARDMIEDFMVAANRTVALWLLERGFPSIRRVVREPKRWSRIVDLAAEVGESLPPVPDSVALSEFLARRRAADPEHFADLSLAVVKLLGPGRYVLERRMGDRRNAGHFGLAVADYVHSTAPNRRYADLVTQRMLRAALTKQGPPYADDELVAIADRCTERSDAARKVERTMRKAAGAAMLGERIGDAFTAIVTSSSKKGIYARVLSPPVEGRIVRGGRGLDVGDTVRLRLVSTDPARGWIDFEHEESDVEHKRERRQRKKAMADRLRSRIGETFEATVSGVSESGTWVRTSDGTAEGKIIRGAEGLQRGMPVTVRLVATDSVHGFIDFENVAAVDPRKEERRERKRHAAQSLADRIGDTFLVVVTGVSQKATWVRTVPDVVEGRLVRGRRGLEVGHRVNAVLLEADPRRGYIDFARD